MGECAVAARSALALRVEVVGERTHPRRSGDVHPPRSAGENRRCAGPAVDGGTGVVPPPAPRGAAGAGRRDHHDFSAALCEARRRAHLLADVAGAGALPLGLVARGVAPDLRAGIAPIPDIS